MALNIRNVETERLATRLAKLTGEIKTAAVTKAQRDRLARVARDRHGRRLAVTLPQGHAACRAFARDGKGRHPAGLNFGDCFAYALAAERHEPLLFEGEDFDKTDLFR